jgi:hypothetical protein
MSRFNGLVVDLASIHRLSDVETRSISAENPTGEKGKGGMESPPIDPETGQATGPARDLGRGWKLRPSAGTSPGDTRVLADIQGPGAIQSIWMTPAGCAYRNGILRIYWDDQEHPSVECPIGDFFASAYTSYNVYAPLNSHAVCVNPGNAFNCYWPMPFRKRCRITLENRDAKDGLNLYYQINYALGPVEDDAAYFHAQFRRVNPLPYGKVYTILDNVRGKGHYAGTYMAWGLNNNGWWGEGEIKFYMDGDIPAGKTVDEAVAEHGGDCFPTICGTGTEDYFCGSYNFENKTTKQYQEFNTPYAGVPHIVRPDGVYRSQMRFSMYRWHLPDPIRFKKDLAVTIQAIGWRSGGRYLALQDDIASVAYWYQTLPTAPFPELPDRDALEIV